VAVWKYTLAGTDLNEFRAQIVTVDGLEGMPARRGQNVVVPYRHGSYTSARKWYQPRLGAMTVRVFDTNSAGAVTDGDGQWAHSEDNLDRFKALLYANNTVTLRKTMADGSSTRDLEVEFLGDVIVQQLDPSRGIFDVRVTFEAADPFWTGAASTATYSNLTAGTAPTISVGGEAPVDDMVFTFTIDSDATGLQVQVDDDGTIMFPGTASAGTVVVDVGARTVQDGAGSALAGVVDVDRAYWVEFSPNSSNELDIAITSGQVDVQVVWSSKFF